MIDFNAAAFPTNVVQVLYNRFKIVDEKIQAVPRGLKANDPHLTVGIFAETWAPEPVSKEMFGETGPAAISTLRAYYVQIHTLGSGLDIEQVQAQHSVLAGIVRDLVEFDQPLRVALTALRGRIYGSEIRMEYLKSYEALNQEYFSLEGSGSGFVNLGALRCKIVTEVR